MRVGLMSVLAVFSAILFASGNLYAHCEIPCGIYDDELRAKLIEEHAGTIQKSMEAINSYGTSKKGGPDQNQLVRWINNKDDHANKIQDIVAQYFMTQRIKPGDDQYDAKLAALHEILIYAMQCKQTTDVLNVKRLLGALGKFKKLYFSHHHGGDKPKKGKASGKKK